MITKLNVAETQYVSGGNIWWEIIKWLGQSFAWEHRHEILRALERIAETEGKNEHEALETLRASGYTFTSDIP